MSVKFTREKSSGNVSGKFRGSDAENVLRHTLYDFVDAVTTCGLIIAIVVAFLILVFA